MFDSKHYVPILKWKRAEQGALRLLEEKHKKHITPLVQFVMPQAKNQEQLADVVLNFEKQLPEIAEKIIEVWGVTPIFIDVSLLFTTPLKAKSLQIISQKGHQLGGTLIPVFHLNDDQEIKKIACALAKANRSGACLRLICPDFADPSKLSQGISTTLSSCGLKENDIDLLVDIKETGINSDKYAKFFDLSQNIPNLTNWRTFIFSSGSFPEDLSGCKLDEENLIPRIDWKCWKNYNGAKKIQRKAAFGDYAIQHPIYKESSQFYHPTTSIKYALKDEWLIMKGKKQKFEMYLASAKILAEDKRFYGENFSNGDKYISEKARHFDAYMKDKNIGGTGSTETWIRAGVNHHLVITANQVANLL